ncbi:MAG: hypothetical protein HKN75_00745 [Bacteroidia bacterium]|nr:hypothetical protein [Bacteroidia bacterium]
MKKITLALLVQIVISSTCIAGGPWTQEKGNGYFKISEWWVIYDQHYNKNGDIIKIPHSKIFNTTIYAEYGITNKLTGILNAVPFSNVQGKIIVRDNMNNYTTEVDEVTAMGNADLGLKYQLMSSENSLPLSATVLFGLPTGDNAAGEQNTLQTGDGAFKVLAQLDAGNSFTLGNINGFGSAHFGYNLRSDDYSDELKFGVDLGLSFFDSKFWLITRINAVESLKNGSRNDDDGTSFIYANNTEYVGLALEGSYLLTDNIGISAEAAGAFRAENVAAAPSYSLGIFYQLKK